MNSYKDFRHIIFWVTICFIIKISILFAYLSFLPPSSDPKIWTILTPDGHSYIDPVESYIRAQGYFPDYRMPGLGFFYYLFRLFLDKYLALNALLIFQTLISSISIYYLARLAHELLSSKFVFYSTFFLSSLGLYLAQFDALILTESLSLSFIVFFIYCLFQLYDKRKKESYYLIFSGIHFTFLVFLKPVYLPLALMASFVVLSIARKHNNTIIAIIKKGALLFAPLILTIGLWAHRNYQVHHNFSPLNNGYFYPYLESSVKWQWMRLLKASGEKISINQEKHPKVLWIDQPIDSLRANAKSTQKFELPDEVFTSEFNRDDLIEIAMLYKESQKINRSEQKKLYQELVALSYKKISRFIVSLKEEKPLFFYIISPLKLLIKYVRTPFGYYDTQTKSPAKKMVLLYYSFWYWIILVFGILGMSLWFIKSKKNSSVLFLVPVFYTLLAFPLILRLSENRYIALAFPFLIIFASYLIDHLRRRFLYHNRII